MVKNLQWSKTSEMYFIISIEKNKTSSSDWVDKDEKDGGGENYG